MSSMEFKSWINFNTILFKNDKFWCEVLILLFWQRSPSGKHKFPLLLSSRPQSSGYSWSLPVHWTKIENFNSELQVNLVNSFFIDLYLEIKGRKKINLKSNYFKKQRFSASFLLTWSKYTGQKWLWNTQQASLMS